MIIPLHPRLRDLAAAFRAEEARRLGDPAPALRAWRASQGCYEQRDGRFMLRVRLPAGLIGPEQVRFLAGLARTHHAGRLHLTTRQDLQFHDLESSALADLQEALPRADLAAGGSGGDRPRNVVAHPRAGVDPAGVFDVRPWALAISDHLVAQDAAWDLPRKFKVAVSGTAADECHAQVSDCGFIAVRSDGQPGFTWFAAGGLGNHPRPAIRIDDFISADEAPAAAAAALHVFAAEGDRQHRGKARFRYVAARLGDDAVRRLILERFAVERGRPAPPQPVLPVRAPALGAAVPLPADLAVAPFVQADLQPGRYTLRLAPPLGDLSAAQADLAADLAEYCGDGLLRAAPDQALLICGIPGGRLAEAVERAGRADLLDRAGRQALACSGASVCRLGTCRSRDLAARLRDSPVAGVRISGCPNSCACHHVAAIGLEGVQRQVAGAWASCYEVHAGGRVDAAGVVLGRRLGSVREDDLPDLLREIAALGADPTPEAIAPLVAARKV